MGGEEGILYADIDLEICVREKITHDFAGHYNRADVFSLHINREAPAIYRPCEGVVEEEPAENHPEVQPGNKPAD
jgi:aliphatic nitrilase